CFPDPRSPAVSGGLEERVRARGGSKSLGLLFRRVSRATQSAQFEEATAALAAYRKALDGIVPTLKAAEPWSLFNRDIHHRHFATVRQLNQAATDPALARTHRLDID